MTQIEGSYQEVEGLTRKGGELAAEITHGEFERLQNSQTTGEEGEKQKNEIKNYGAVEMIQAFTAVVMFINIMIAAGGMVDFVSRVDEVQDAMNKVDDLKLELWADPTANPEGLNLERGKSAERMGNLSQALYGIIHEVPADNIPEIHQILMANGNNLAFGSGVEQDTIDMIRGKVENVIQTETGNAAKNTTGGLIGTALFGLLGAGVVGEVKRRGSRRSEGNRAERRRQDAIQRHEVESTSSVLANSDITITPEIKSIMDNEGVSYKVALAYLAEQSELSQQEA